MGSFLQFMGQNEVSITSAVLIGVFMIYKLLDKIITTRRKKIVDSHIQYKTNDDLATFIDKRVNGKLVHIQMDINEINKKLLETKLEIKEITREIKRFRKESNVYKNS